MSSVCEQCTQPAIICTIKCNDVSSPHTADRDPSRSEGKTEIGATNQSPVNKPADQWEPGGKDATLMPTPPPQLESCLREQGGEVDERRRGKGGGTGKTDPGYSSPEKDTIGSRREDSC